MPDHAGTEHDMLFLDRYYYGVDMDNGSGDAKKTMVKFTAADDSKEPPELSREGNSKAKSSSVCSRLRPLREIAHHSERDSHGRTSPTPTPALTLTSSQE